MTHDRKMLHALTVTAMSAGLLLTGAGTAQAVPGQGIDVSWTPSPAGLSVTVKDTEFGGGRCTYDATAVGWWAPPYHHEFELADNGAASWFIPVIPLGTTWRTVVRCMNPDNKLTGYFEQTSAY
ncbi:hypothetical protein [Mycolicibacterium phlei]|jgi:hypothetical protein